MGYKLLAATPWGLIAIGYTCRTVYYGIAVKHLLMDSPHYNAKAQFEGWKPLY